MPSQTAELLAQGFIESKAAFPNNNALYIDGNFYTYSEILEKAEIIFAQLKKFELPTRIGIYTYNSVWTYAAIIAISLSGACYVPLSNQMPNQRIASQIKLVGLKLIISEHKIAVPVGTELMVINQTFNERKAISALVQQDLAYILFTSGTTGEPKGVPVSKKNTSAFFSHYKKNFDFNANDKFLQPYVLNFDVSVFSIFSAWNCGACVYVVPETGFKYLNCMTMIKEQGITVSSFVPGVLQYIEKYLDEFSFPALRYSFFSGDKLLQTLAEKWHVVAKNALIYNCYGPTETTIVCTEYLWQKDLSSEEAHNNIVSLGKPFENMQTVFLDDHDNVNRVSGELCFSGPQVIDAYLDEKQHDKFFDFEGNRYYKTGDLAGYNKNGNLVFYGRKDSQVKINGYRVELLEVEQAIRHVTKKNVVVLPNTTNEMPVLIAFIETSEIDMTDLKLKLKEILPDYMIPNSYKLVKEFPKSINGKIDIQHLKKMTDA